MRKKQLTSDVVIDAINYFVARYEQYIPCGLCGAFHNGANYHSGYIMELLDALGGRQTNGYYWRPPYLRNYKAHEQRMMFLAFLLTWVENP
mgnify:CR=1 FL=1